MLSDCAGDAAVDMAAEAVVSMSRFPSRGGRRVTRRRGGPNDPYRFSLESLALFLAVSECGGSQTKAAVNLGTQLQYISRHMIAIQSEFVGVQLWRRHGRSPSELTAAGLKLAVHAKRILDDLQTMLTDLQALPPETQPAPRDELLAFTESLAEEGRLMPLESIATHPEAPVRGYAKRKQILRQALRDGDLREDAQGRVIPVQPDEPPPVRQPPSVDLTIKRLCNREVIMQVLREYGPMTSAQVVLRVQQLLPDASGPSIKAELSAARVAGEVAIVARSAQGACVFGLPVDAAAIPEMLPVPSHDVVPIRPAPVPLSNRKAILRVLGGGVTLAARDIARGVRQQLPDANYDSIMAALGNMKSRGEIQTCGMTEDGRVCYHIAARTAPAP